MNREAVAACLHITNYGEVGHVIVSQKRGNLNKKKNLNKLSWSVPQGFL